MTKVQDPRAAGAARPGAPGRVPGRGAAGRASVGRRGRVRRGLWRSGREIPLDLFEVDRPAPETRAVTPAPSTGTGVTVAPVQPFVFAPSIAPQLGIDMPSVGSGGYSEMTISTALTPMPEAKGDAADGTAGALAAVTTTPRRISARLSLSLEDVAAIGTATFESALRAPLRCECRVRSWSGASQWLENRTRRTRRRARQRRRTRPGIHPGSLSSAA